MRVIRAEHIGMCFGVRDAIVFAKEQSAIQPVTILGELVHNEQVLADLRENGIELERELSRVATPTVMITAHGTSERALDAARKTGRQVLEATCPLVHFAHRMLKRVVGSGFHPVIVGKRDHVEVRGMTDDLTEFDVVLSESDIADLKERAKFGVIAQTTQPIDKVRRLVATLCERFPASEVQFLDTVCQPTKQRQTAAVKLSQQSDVVIVIGGAHSNNTRELVTTSLRFCPRVHHIQGPADLLAHWFEECEVAGLTAGTSTPDPVIDEVERRILELTAEIGVPIKTHAAMNGFFEELNTGSRHAHKGASV